MFRLSDFLSLSHECDITTQREARKDLFINLYSYC